MLRILADTAADITKDRATEWGVELITIPIEFEDGPHEQGGEEDIRRFYEKLQQSRELPRTSQPIFGELVEKFEEIREAGDEAVVLLLSRTISGTVESAQKARELVGYDGIDIIDTKNGTTGQSLIVQMAVALRNQGLSRVQMIEKLQWVIDHVEAMASVDTLEYLKKGGRIPPALAIVGNALKLKPLIHFNPQGQLVSLRRDRGTKAAHRNMIQEMVNAQVHPDYPVLVGYTSNRTIAEEVRDRLSELLDREDIELRPISGVVGTHLGTNSVSIAAVVEQRP
ncbi:MAG: DegV family protein [Ndongobacter sp.]|nr:DegV family protein [Ndongobacter sp.]